MAELRRSQQYLRLFMDHSPVTAFIKDEEGRYLYVNKMMADCFLKDSEEWLGHTNRELWGEEAARETRRAGPGGARRRPA